MPDPEVERAAEFLATHALLLLGLGIASVAVSFVAIGIAVRVVGRLRPSLLHGFTWLLQRAGATHLLSRFVTRTSLLVPSAYLGLHLVLGLVLVVAVTVFVALSEQVIAGGEMAAFDAAFARALHNETSPEWERLFDAVSWLGSRHVLAFATLVVAAALILRRRMIIAIAWLAAQAGGGLLNLALKETFERTRPEFADPLLASSSWSFPSGHAMGTFIFCGLACYLVFRARRSWIAVAIALILALSWCVVMAFSRLYLGVHFVSDVLAGLIAGTAWVSVCVSSLEVIRQSRSHVRQFDVRD